MNKKLLSLAVVTALSIGFTACGSSGGDDSVSGGDTTTNVEVERGKVYDANVTDSSTPPKVAKMTVGSNIYKFATTPTYPIVASGGWIDVDGDGNMTTSDIVNDLNLTSYSNVITPTTSYLGDISTTAGKAKLDKLIEEMNVTKEDLLKAPSKASANAIVIANAIYKKRKQVPSVKMSEISFSDLNTTFEGLKGLLVGHSSDTLPSLAILIENQVVNTDLSGIVNKLNTTQMNEIKDKRPDIIKPTVTITDNKVGTATTTDPITFTFTFSENVSGFNITDIIVSGGTKGTLNGNGTVYTLDITPNPKSTSNITIDISANSFQDTSSNGNEKVIQYIQSVNTPLEYGTITSSITGKIWLDRNVGASKVCSSLTDSACFGDYFQWGRNADGHEKLNSSITSTQATSTSNVGHGKFIYSYDNNNYDWANSVDSQGTTRQTNWNPCISGYRIPTINELLAENLSETPSGSLNSLKLPIAGIRNPNADNGEFRQNIGMVWTSTLDTGEYVKSFSIEWGSSYSYQKAYGMPIRCIKE
jgi:hypothetical protein